MWIDPLVEEVRKRRQELMAEYDYDPKKILQAVKKEEEKHADRLVSLNKKPKKTYKSKSTTSKNIGSSVLSVGMILA